MVTGLLSNFSVLITPLRGTSLLQTVLLFLKIITKPHAIPTY